MRRLRFRCNNRLSRRGLLYHILLSHLDRDKEEIIIETGTNFGCTSIVLAQALKDSEDGRVITIELEIKCRNRKAKCS